MLDEGVDGFVAADVQTLFAEGMSGLFGFVGVCKLDAERTEPIEVLDASFAKQADSFLVTAVTGGETNVVDHVGDAVLEPAGLLHARPATQVANAGRKRGGATTTAGALEHQRLGPGARRLDRGTGPGAAEPDHQHVTGVVPLADLGFVQSGSGIVSSHNSSATSRPITESPITDPYLLFGSSTR